MTEGTERTCPCALPLGRSLPQPPLNSPLPGNPHPHPHPPSADPGRLQHPVGSRQRRSNRRVRGHLRRCALLQLAVRRGATASCPAPPAVRFRAPHCALRPPPRRLMPAVSDMTSGLLRGESVADAGRWGGMLSN